MEPHGGHQTSVAKNHTTSDLRFRFSEPIQPKKDPLVNHAQNKQHKILVTRENPQTEEKKPRSTVRRSTMHYVSLIRGDVLYDTDIRSCIKTRIHP